ncbi:FMN reductase [Angustibacter luteus]|uniref:FMN reductase n=1 Tax=Angustibacter luteus TaxID=658456 RepID=A0ABW1JG85_9ACTN
MSRRSLVVVSAGLSQPSSTRLLADRLSQATVTALAAHGQDVDVRVVELRELAHDLANHLLTGFPPPALREAVDAVAAADAVVAVTPIFNASYSGLFKTFFDVLDEGSLGGTPVLLAATGGTARHSLALDFALRPLFAYLRADVVPTAVFAATEDWGGGSLPSSLSARVERAGGELAAAVTGRPRVERVDPFDDPTPFEQLLAGH